MKVKAVPIVLIFLSLAAVVNADEVQLRTGKSGITFKIMGMGKMYFTKGTPALMLKYQTDSDVTDLKALRKEARQIWIDFGDDADASGLSSAIISANAPSKGGVITHSKGYNFVFEKAPNGNWTCLDDEINKWLLVINEKDPQKQLAGLKKWAAAGDDMAMGFLGNIYQLGSDSIPKDPAEAVKWYKSASQAGDAVAGNNLGLMILDGDGVKQDYQAAFQWFTWAAKRGNALGEENLGLMYRNGLGVPKDYQKAAEYYTQASEKGTADAMDALGTLYVGGLGVKKDLDRAFELIQQAAEWGSSDGQSDLSYLYAKGVGTKEDCDEAFKWAKLSAGQGSPSGEDNLGSCYEEGCGVEKNIPEALKYYQLSADHGSPSGKDDLDRLKAGKTE